MKTSILTFSPKGDTELILCRPNFRKRNEPKNESTAHETAPENEVVKVDDTKTENGQPTEDQLPASDGYSDQSSSVHNTDDLKALTASDEKGHSVEIRLRVSSAHLILSSPVFRAMLDGPFSEGIRSKDNLFEVKAFEWNAEALVIVLDIIHGHHRSLPQKVELDILIEIAMLCDYYQCEEIVETFAKQWIAAFEEDKPYEEEATMNWMFVAWVFQREDLFNTKVAMTLQHSKIPVHTDLPLPSTILEKVETQRLKLMNDVLNNLYGLHESLWVTNDDCKTECATMLLGSLMKHMREAGLEIPKPKGLPSTIRSLVGLRRFVSGLETPVCYIANRYGQAIKHECSFKNKTKPWMDDMAQTYRDGFRFEDFRTAINHKDVQ
ncbi:hypothetical protein FNYG_13283 [Fusarium nygamai]|uniref:BTB domain-containing protein n=1 Tax=Gibberella nygamai TaxID=42673 RepID=A0A2K0VTN6_GIBNY|nr:hypothetical protein FNYG_13283 [Fusarium nygamai]